MIVLLRYWRGYYNRVTVSVYGGHRVMGVRYYFEGNLLSPGGFEPVTILFGRSAELKLFIE